MSRTVRDVMTKTVVVVHESAPFKEIARLMHVYRVSALPVVDSADRLVGIISEADLLLKEEMTVGMRTGQRRFEGRRVRAERAKAAGLVAADVMTAPVVTIQPGASLAEAARVMHAGRIKRLPVTGGDGRVCGIVSRSDVLRVFLRSDESIHQEVVQDLIERTLWMDPTPLQVEVKEGVVVVRGELERRGLASVLVGLVQGIEGVVGVEDRLTWRVDDSVASPDPGAPWAVLPYGLRSFDGM